MHERHEGHEHAGATQHKDPVCGMMVQESPNALTFEYKGMKYYFCSSGCRRAFEKDPEKYLK